MYKNLKTQVLADVKKAGLPSSAAVPRMHAAWQSLSQYAMSDGHWQDGYCKTVRSMEDDIDNQTRNPFRLSIDAVFPFTLSRGQMMYHAPGHLVVTALYIHLMKSTFIPAMLAHVAEYIGSDHKSRDLESFMQKMENVYLVGLQSPFTIKARIKTKVSVAEHASIKREWVAGCVTNGQGRMQYIQKHYVHMPKNAPSPDWRPEGFDRIRNLIVAIEGRFPNECLRRGPDGCPFPFHEPNMPSDWSWWSCWRMFNERFVRMKEWCNRNHEMVDTTGTIFLECVWQILDLTITDELFELPISLYQRHPLRFAVAHIEHGRQLRSGWTSAHPECLEDRDASVNNMSFEACIVNWAKSNYPKGFYPAMKKDFQENVSLGNHWHEPSSSSMDDGPANRIEIPDSEEDSGWEDDEDSMSE